MNIRQGASWILPLKWFHPRSAVKAMALQAAESSSLIFVLSSFYGLAFGIDLAMRTETVAMKITLALVVGPMVGIAMVFGGSQLLSEGYLRSGAPCSLPTLRAATVVALNPLFWGLSLRIGAQWIWAHAEALALGGWIEGASQVVGVITLILPWFALWTWQVGVSEATGMPEDKINRRVTNRELLTMFLVIMVVLLTVYGVVTLGLV